MSRVAPPPRGASIFHGCREDARCQCEIVARGRRHGNSCHQRQPFEPDSSLLVERRRPVRGREADSTRPRADGRAGIPPSPLRSRPSQEGRLRRFEGACDAIATGRCRRVCYARDVMTVAPRPTLVAAALFLLSVGAGCSRQQKSAPTETTAASSSAAVSVASAAPSASSADGAFDAKAACLTAARACGKNLVDGNFEGVAGCMPDEVVKIMGGRDVATRVSKSAVEGLARQGTHIEKANIDAPSQVVTSASHTFAVVPQEVVLKTKEGEVRQRAFLLGVSSDGGHSWHFVDGSGLDRNKATKLYPDFPASLTLPDVEQPR